MRINCENCAMKTWCGRVDRDYTCSELIVVYLQSLKQTRKAVAKRKVKLEDLYVINADWAADTRLNVKIGRGLTESFVGMAAREAVLKYGDWIVEGYRGNDVLLYKGD